MGSFRYEITLGLALTLGGVVALDPVPAQACGGTFCDAGPQAMPVDQTGESILFVVGSEGVEAHIRIEYEPTDEATGFAWLVPVTEVPEFSVGSEPLFQNLLQSTRPSYGSTRTTDMCPDSPGGGSSSGGGGSDSPAVFISRPDGGGADIQCDIMRQDCNDGERCVPDGTGGTMCTPLVFEDTVGAFDVVVLDSTSADSIMTWLGDNGYQQDPAAEPLLRQYVAEGKMFAAFKLSSGTDTDSVHPIVLRFPTSDEACIPLRLTRIAAREDMNIRAFFLGDGRAAPGNWRHVVPNPAVLDWPSFASDYTETITMAVDELPANGRAFVTEYAGPSDIVSDTSIWSSDWNAGRFGMINPVGVVGQLATQGLAACITGWCEFNHALLPPIMEQFLPPPPGVEAGEFYGCLECFADQIDLDAWDGVAFGEMLEDRIIAPGLRAKQMLATWPYLTRMFTTISPHEMSSDPTFQVTYDLPPATTLNAQATQRTLCNGDTVWTLPDGREVYVRQGDPWPSFGGEMPAAEILEMVPAVGPPQVEVDNGSLIDEVLRMHNCQYNWPTPWACGEEEDDDSGTDSGSISGTPPDDDASSDDPDDQPLSLSRGCACTADRHPVPPALALIGFAGLLGLRRRRR